MADMKHGSNQRRGRPRGNGGKRHSSSSRNSSLESNGPEGKVRGSAQQILEKYLSLARDATSAGEHIAAEGLYQYAEHYHRVLNVDGANNQNRDRQQHNSRENSTSNDQPTEASAAPAPAPAAPDVTAVDAEVTPDVAPVEKRVRAKPVKKEAKVEAETAVLEEETLEDELAASA